jgi:TatD DNase family protein
MNIFDSHCHLDDKTYTSDFGKILERANRAGVTRMMTVGIDELTSRTAVLLAESHDGIFASVGVHPHDAGNCNQSVLKVLLQLTQRPKVCAWGEIGLDFNRMYSPRREQEKWFGRQLEIAGELDLPMIFHERDSNGRFLEILKRHKQNGWKGVVHCFSGNQIELEQYLNLGLNIGITGIITMKSRGAHLRKLVQLIPADRLLVETDAPYLTPAPEKNHTRRNEPAFVRSVLLKIAAVRSEDPAKLAQIIWENTCRLYGLKP